MSSDFAEKPASKERGSKDENNAALDTVLRLVICQGNPMPATSEFTVAETFVWMYIKFDM
jgi:hypothetical protein